MKIKFKHHQKTKGTDTFEQTHLCFDYQVAGYCKHGNKCKLNHHSRAAMEKGWDATMKRKVKLVNGVIDSLSR